MAESGMLSKPSSLEQETSFTEQQFAEFTGQQSLAEYFHEFITKKCCQVGNIAKREEIERLHIEETAKRYGQKELKSNGNKCEVKGHVPKDQDCSRWSSLSSEDHKAFLGEYERTLQGENLDSTQFNYVQKVKPKVLSEHQEFQHSVYQYARENTDHYNFVYPEARTLLEVREHSPEDTRIHSYPQYYMLQKTVGITVGVHFHNDPFLEFKKNLHVGPVPLISLPNQRVKLELSCEQAYQNAKKKSSRLSQDPVALRLAKEHSIDVVASSGALKTLIDNQPPNYSHRWDIPIVVSELQGNPEKSSKTVFIEKPFPKKLFTPPDLNSKCYKRCIKSVLNPDIEKASERPPCESLDSGKTEAANESSGDCSKAQEERKDHNDRNYVYSLWKLGKLTLLIRSRLDGYRIDGKSSKQNFMSIAVKPEYLSQYGHERLTASETAHMWLKAFVRPATTLLCARVDVSSNEIIRIDELIPSEVLTAGSVFNPASGVKLLFNLFTVLTELFVGTYLLFHDSKAIHCCLYKSVSARVALSSRKPEIDLFARYTKEGAVCSLQSSEIPWSGIDVNLFLAEHIQESRIPGMFPPVDMQALKQMEIKKLAEQEQLLRVHNPKKRKNIQRKGKKKMEKGSRGQSIVFDQSQATSRQNKRTAKAARRYHDLDYIKDV